MSRLIDADAFLEEIDKTGAHHMIISYIKGKITNAPTVQREGWVSVPKQPTDAMLDAGRSIVKIRYVDSDIAAYETYKAMLSAAPKE